MYNITIVYTDGTTQTFYECTDIHLDGIEIVFFTHNYDSSYDRHNVTICNEVASLVIH